ncbi:hypothetical protein [Okeania sp. SIO2C2]|nr:hypothetical protein [Okeania sp. SIO2C2]
MSVAELVYHINLKLLRSQESGVRSQEGIKKEKIFARPLIRT